MKGVRILVHAVRQVTGNLGEALRISAVLYLASQAAILGVGYAVAGRWSLAPWALDDPYVETEAASFPAAAWLAFLLSALLWWVLTVWIAVRWHRFVLLEEHPERAIPPWDGMLVWAYVVRSIKIGVVMIAAVIGFFLALQVLLLWDIAVPLLVMGGLLFGVLLIALPLRIGLGLPAAALGGGISTAESWRKTAPAWGSILVLAVLLVLLTSALGVLTGWLGRPAALGLAVSLVVEWIELMVWAAVLTTLYGHLVEGRALG